MPGPIRFLTVTVISPRITYILKLYTRITYYLLLKPLQNVN